MCLPCSRYSTLWQWADNTVALYYRFDYWPGLFPSYCAAYRVINAYGTARYQLKMIDCYAYLKVDFLCEIPFKSDMWSVYYSDISLPAPVRTASDIQRMIECKDHHATWQFLGCDSGRRDTPDTPPCPHDRRDLDSLWFQCRDTSGCVPYTLVCDHRQDCADGSDEDFCVFQRCISKDFVCRNEKQVCLPVITSIVP